MLGNRVWATFTFTAHICVIFCMYVETSLPLKSLEEVIRWKPGDDTLKCRVPLVLPSAGEERAKVLACHDMKGGYLDDRFVSTKVFVWFRRVCIWCVLHELA